MLETAELGRKIGKQEYKEQVPLLRTELLRETNAPHSPWFLVEGSDRRGRELTVGRHLADAIRNRLGVRPASPAPPVSPASLSAIDPEQPKTLRSLYLSQRLSQLSGMLRGDSP
jgi:hypothetical protein